MHVQEASDLIQKAYSRHKALADNSKSFPPSLSVKDLEKIGVPYHYPPKDFIDRLALGSMKFLRVFVHAFFREKYDHHAVCLETVAAVPGLVGGFHRHLRSLRRMKRDHGCKYFDVLSSSHTARESLGSRTDHVNMDVFLSRDHGFARRSGE